MLKPTEKIAILNRLVKIDQELKAEKGKEKPALMVVAKLSKERVELRLKITEGEVKKPESYGIEKGEGEKTRQRINDQVADMVGKIKAGAIDPKNLTEEQKDLMRKYSGQGGIRDNNSQDEYYTPQHVAEGVWDILKENGYQNGNVLEPSTGNGVFLGTKPAGSVISGAEISEISATVAQTLHPEDRVVNEPFEGMVMRTPDGSFDAVVGNVPFGFRGQEASIDKDHRKEKRMELYFVRRVIDKVKHGGLITLVVPESIVSSSKLKKFRAEISLKAEFLGAHKLPSKTFAQQGTDVVTDVLVMRKHSEDMTAKIAQLPPATLRKANVLWEEFISGLYFKGEGRKFIHGTYVEADKDAFRGSAKVIADPAHTPEVLKKRLARKFDSRIDYTIIDAAPAIPEYYSEGDKKLINGTPMVFRNGEWEISVVEEERGSLLDSARYGASSIEALQAMLATPDGALNLTYAQAKAIATAYPALLTKAQAQAVAFADRQKDKYRQMAFRGSLLGAVVNAYAFGEDATDRNRVIRLLQDEISRNGHPKTIKGLVIDGAEAADFGRFVASIDKDGNVSSIVTGEGQEKAKGFSSDDVESIVAHLSRIGNDAIELKDIQAMYSGSRKINSLGDIADVPNIAIDENGYVDVMNEFLRGDAYARVGRLQDAMAKETDQRMKEHWNGLIEKLMSSVNRTAIDSISFGLRDKWIPRHYKEEFFRTTGYNLEFREGVAIDEDGEKIAFGDGSWAFTGRDYGGLNFGKQLSHYMNGNSITHNLRGSGPKDEQEADKLRKANEAQQKIKDLEDQFRTFMQSHSDSLDIENEYNALFNRHITTDFSSDELGLRGISSTIQLKWYQNQGVRRLSENGTGILGHDVGLGKTFQALAFSAYDRQMGRSKKHCFVVPNSVLSNWYHESKMFLGKHDDVVFVGFHPKMDKAGKIMQEPILDEFGKQRTGTVDGKENQPLFQDVIEEDKKEEWYEKLHRIPGMNTGLVIMTEEKFKMIPVMPETLGNYAQKMIDGAMISQANADALTGVKEEGVKKKTAHSYAQEQLQAKIAYESGKTGSKRDFLPFWEDLGFDRVVVDEAHRFKSPFTVAGGEGLDKLAYLALPASSQRAQDLSIKLEHVKEKNNGKGAILLSATPVTSSPVEIYNMLVYIIPPEDMEMMGIFTAADFIKFFGTLEGVEKLTVSGTIEPRNGLKGFRNLNALRNLFHRYVDMKDAKMVDPNGDVLKLPDSTEINDVVDMTEDQEALYKQLREEAIKSRNKKAVQSGEARPMFSVIREMERVTTDLDLYNGEMTFLFDEGDAKKLRQLIQSLPETKVIDIKAEEDDPENGIEKGDKIKKILKRNDNFTTGQGKVRYVVAEEWEEEIIRRMESFGIENVSHPIPPKYRKLIGNIQKELAANESAKQLIFTEEKSQHNKILRILETAVTVAREKVAIINADTANDEKMQAIVDSYTRGDFTLIIANKKAEVGVNLQKGTTAIHHLTFPWTPASIKQRNGRGVRQGNRSKYVNVYYYSAKKSFDEYRLDLLKKKGSWIGALLDKNNTNDTHDNENADNEMEQQAILAEDKEEFLKKMAEIRARKEAEEKARIQKKARISLSQLTAVNEYLDSFDMRKQTALNEANHERELAQKGYDEATANNTGDAESMEKIERRKRRLDKAKADITGFDAKWAAKKAEAESKKKILRGDLTAIAKRGELPFDAGLIDRKEVYMASNGTMLYAGGVYEYDNGRVKKILRIASFGNGIAKIEPISGEFGKNEIGISDMQKGGSFTEVAYSPKEIDILKSINGRVDYKRIPDLMSKDEYLRFRGKITFSGTRNNLPLEKNGVIEIETSANTGDEAVYPDRNDNALKARMIELYQANLAEKWPTDLDTGMEAIFGADWKEAIAEKIKTASEAQLNEKAREIVSRGLRSNYASEQEIFNKQTDIYQGQSEYKLEIRKWMQQNGYANILDAESAVVDAASEIRAELGRKMIQVREEAKKAADEKLKADPRFKELTEAQSARFDKLKVTVFFNREKIGEYGALDWMFLYDKAGFNGVLKSAKDDVLKPMFNAKWTGKTIHKSVAQMWAMSSAVDIEKLLTKLESKA